MDTVKRVREVPIEVRDMVRRVLLNHVGEANAIHRPELAHEVAARLGLNGDMPTDFDRTCRKAVEWLRRNDKFGALIASSPRKAGYWIEASPDGLEKAISSRERKARKELQTCSIQRRDGLEAQKALPLEQGHLL